jgi:hypothetical protein
VRLDAAPSYAYRSPKSAQAIGGISATGIADDPMTTTDESDPDPDHGLTPPPSIDGKGTLINTYA